MRDLIVLLIVMGLMPTAFRRPYLGLLLFSWLAYMRPQDLCWGFARTMRLSFFVSASMLLGWWANEQEKRRFTRWEPRTSLLLVLLALVLISYAQAKVHNNYTNTYVFEYMKIVVIALFTIGQCDTRQRLRGIFWVIAISLGFFGVKNGLFGMLRGGGQIIRGPGGMLEDNNDFALALVMNIPLLWYLGISEKKKWVLLASRVAVGLTVVAILLTHSRGAFLAMGFTALWIAWRSGHLFRASLALIFLATMFLCFAPQEILDRMASITDTKETSVQSRFESWATAIEMIKDNPVWGVGLRNFLTSVYEYTVTPVGVAFKPHVAHNSYLQIWAECGSIAFAVYMALLISIFVSLRRIYVLCRKRPDLHWAMNYARMMEATTVGFAVGAFFLNRGHFDLFYHWLALVVCLNFVAMSALKRGPDVGLPGGKKKRGVSKVVVSLPGVRTPRPVLEADLESGQSSIVWKNRKRWR